MRLLRGALFVPEHWQHALYAPPFASRALTGTGAGWERFGAAAFSRPGRRAYGGSQPSRFMRRGHARAGAGAGAGLLKPAGTE